MLPRTVDRGDLAEVLLRLNTARLSHSSYVYSIRTSSIKAFSSSIASWTSLSGLSDFIVALIHDAIEKNAPSTPPTSNRSSGALGRQFRNRGKDIVM